MKREEASFDLLIEQCGLPNIYAIQNRGVYYEEGYLRYLKIQPFDNLYLACCMRLLMPLLKVS